MNSIAYELGALYGCLRAIRRKTKKDDIPFGVALGAAGAAYIAVGVAEAVTEEIKSAVDSASTKRSGNPPPELTAIKKTQLEMPTEYPFHRDNSHWPPFEGVRVELGSG